MRTNTTMKLTALAAAIGFVMSSGAFAASTAQQTVTYEVQEVADIIVSGNPGALIIAAAVAGAAPTPVTNALTTYAISTNKAGGKKIAASINTDMPDDVTLAVELAPPTGAASPGSLALSTVAVDVVTGIIPVNESGKTITYTLSALPTAGVIVSAEKTVTFSILDN